MGDYWLWCCTRRGHFFAFCLCPLARPWAGQRSAGWRRPLASLRYSRGRRCLSPRWHSPAGPGCWAGGCGPSDLRPAGLASLALGISLRPGGEGAVFGLVCARATGRRICLPAPARRHRWSGEPSAAGLSPAGNGNAYGHWRCRWRSCFRDSLYSPRIVPSDPSEARGKERD